MLQHVRSGPITRLMVVLVAVLLVGVMPAQQFAQAGPIEDRVLVVGPQACPAAPASLPSIEERTNFCVYYNTANTTDAQADNAADFVQTYWDRYVTDFGFRAPAFTGKLEVQLVNDSDCNGGTSSSSNNFTTNTGCFATTEELRNTLGHELFHRVQYSYDGVEVRWFKEGTARIMEDTSFDVIDNWAASLSAAFSFNQQVNIYLASTNADITSDPMRYNSALWWKYFSEQFGTTAGEPQRGVDAYRRLWEAADGLNDIAAINSALSALGAAGFDFNRAFRRFTVANWTKDLSGLPDGSYNYIDEEQVGNPAPYGPLFPTNGGAISNGTSASFANQSVARYGARYYRAQPNASCQVITAAFHKDSGADVFYHVVTQKGTVFAKHVEGSATDWTQSFLNDGITQIVAIIGGQNNAGQVDVTLGCATPVLDIKQPNSTALAFAGPFDTPGKILAQVQVTNGDPKGPVVGGLTVSDFQATVNGVPALVTGGGFVQEQYFLVIDAPVQAANGTYDLQISLETPGTSTVIATDTNPTSVRYIGDNSDQVLVIDRSGSMGVNPNPRLPAAKAAANFYVDVSRNGDGLGVVFFNQDVNPAPFALQTSNLTVRNNAKNYINSTAISASGGTSIGDGMQAAVTQRTGSTTGNPRCSFVLLSDGMENSAALWSTVQASVQATACPVTAIAFGPQSDETLMQNIATATGGLFFYNDVFTSSNANVATAGVAPQAVSADDMALDLGSTYEYAQAKVGNRQRMLQQKGAVPENRTEQVHKVNIDGSVSEALFTVDWTATGLAWSLRLRDPNGNIIAPPSRQYDFYDRTSGHAGYRIANPTPGTWEMLVTYDFQIPLADEAAQPQQPTPPRNYQVLVSGKTRLSLELLLPDRTGARPTTGNRVPIYAFLSSANPIPNAQVQALVTAPDNSTTTVPLFDDGQHDDGAAGDGFYANTYTRVNQANPVPPPNNEGTTEPLPKDEAGYRVKGLAVGSNFTRETLGSFSVLEGADANNNQLPDAYEQENNVTGGNADPDTDSFDNLSEYISGTNPNNSDTDGSGENDGSELVLHSQNALGPADDQIVAPEFFKVYPDVGSVRLEYDVKAEYTQMLFLRSASPTGPWILGGELPLTGLFTDPRLNGQAVYYRMLAVNAANHRSAVLQAGPVTPSADPNLPEAKVLIDNGAATTPDLQVNLQFLPYETEADVNFADITTVLISNDPTMAGAQTLPFGQNIAWTLADTPAGGTARVYVRFRDGAGNESVDTAVDAIVYDPQVTPPPGTRLYLPLVVK